MNTTCAGKKAIRKGIIKSTNKQTGKPHSSGLTDRTIQPPARCFEAVRERKKLSTKLTTNIGVCCTMTNLSTPTSGQVAGCLAAYSLECRVLGVTQLS